MALGVRESGALLACCILLLLAVRQEGDIRIERRWGQAIEGVMDGVDGEGIMATYANGIAPMENEIPPPPLITDIDGDGQNEVVLVTREPKLKIFKFKGGGAAAGAGIGAGKQQPFLGRNRQLNMDQLVLVREVGLLTSLRLTSGRQIVGLSSGYIRPYSSTRNRKQVIVVVNESWGIFVFNHKLRLMWTRSIEVDLSRRFLAETAILIDPHPMRRAGSSATAAHNDTGVIIIGGRVASKASLNKASYMGQAHFESELDSMGPRPLEFPDAYPSELEGRILRPGSKSGSVRTEDATQRHSHTHGGMGGETHGRDPMHDQHFSYYAFEGLRGDTRWKHDATSFHEESPASSIWRPQHDTSSMHSGEMDWRVFRRSILDVALPHSWAPGRSATKMTLAHVEKTRSGTQKQSVKASRTIKSNFFVRDTFGQRPHSENEHVLNPNAIVVHLREGIEILHLYSGRPLCRLTLKAGEVHVDMDGDGVIDHVEVVGEIHRPHRVHSRADEHGAGAEHSAPCTAVVRSGIPPSRQLFNASICIHSWTDVLRFGPVMMPRIPVHRDSQLEHSSASHAHVSRGGGQNDFGIESTPGSLDSPGSSGSGTGAGSAINFLGKAFREAQESQKDIRVAQPIVVQEPQTVGKPAKKRRYHSFFYLNNGLVSSFNHDGSRAWHVLTKASWLLQSSPSHHASDELFGVDRSFRPSLHPFALRVDYPADHVLVVGEKWASLVTLAGNVRAEVELPRDRVVAQPIVADFNQDGVNDFVIITTRGYYGFSVSRRLGSHLFSLLVLLLVLLLAAVFAFQLAHSHTVVKLSSSYSTRMRGAGGVGMGMGMGMGRNNKTTFTSGLRMTKSLKAQL